MRTFLIGFVFLLGGLLVTGCSGSSGAGDSGGMPDPGSDSVSLDAANLDNVSSDPGDSGDHGTGPVDAMADESGADSADTWDAGDEAGDRIGDDASDQDPGLILDDVVQSDIARDVPFFDLPPLTSLAKGFHVPVVAPDPGQPFSILVASDPQLWWNFIDGAPGPTDEEVEDQNLLHIAAMNALIAGNNLPQETPAPIALVMNGDLTEYGRWNQWDAYYRLYEQVNAPIFDGLGNHDYQNNNFYVNQDGCGMTASDAVPWQNACDAGSEQTLWGQDACTVVGNIIELWGWCATDTMRRTRFWLENHGEHLFDYDLYSGAYSWEFGDFHFIQIHNGTGFEHPEAQICDTLPWLKKDLRAAFDRGKRIVLNLHHPVPLSMVEILMTYRYQMAGIFYGHHHRYGGYTGDLVVGDVRIPRFYGGSVEWNIFTLAYFQGDRLTVTTIDSNNGEPVHYETAAEYDNVSGAYVAAPFTYVFPDLPCPVGQAPDGPEGACIVPERDDSPLVPCY